MGDVINKVSDEVPERFSRLDIFLAAEMAIPSINYSPTI
jgi:hypothetical protein